jgi:hypothetical protein
MKPPSAQPKKGRVANVTIAKSRVLAVQVLWILSTKGLSGVVSFENFMTFF